MYELKTAIYAWNDAPHIHREATIAVAKQALSEQDIETLLEHEGVFFIFDNGEDPLDHDHEFKILAIWENEP